VSFRAKWMDPDFRRDSHTPRYCIMCQRDLKDGQPHRRVMFELDRYEAIHGEDWEIAEPEIRARREHFAPVERGLLGMDCARRLGLEWSRPPE
jgi:hypothetical protein